MDHEPHIALVDPHAERDGGHDHIDLVAGERILVAGALRLAQAGVVGHGAHALRHQPSRQSFDGATAHAVDDAVVAAMAADDPENILARVALGDTWGALAALAMHRDVQVGPVERTLEAIGLLHTQLADDVAADAARRRRRQRQHRDLAELGLQVLQLAVRRPEVMAPLADAVRLIDHHEAQAALGDDRTQGALEPLGRDIDEFDLAPAECFEAAAAFFEVDGRVEHGRPEAEPQQRVDLVLHQRDQRRDHQHGARQQLRGKLERERLAGARGHHPDAIAAGEHGIDDAPLPGAEVAITEHPLQHLLRIRECRGVEQWGVGHCGIGHGPSMD